MKLTELTILVRGGGDLASGVIHRLVRSNFLVCITEIPNPQSVRREVSFCESVYEGEKEVEGVTAKLISSPDDIHKAWGEGKVPLIVDPQATVKETLKPDVLIDAIIAKKNMGTRITDAPLVIGLGPGFHAGRDVHMVIETNRGHNLGKVILEGEAEPDTGIPGEVAGFASERVFRAPKTGRFLTERHIGDHIQVNEVIAFIDNFPIKAAIPGIIRGILRNGVEVHQGMKLGDIDPRGIREHCYTISDKSSAIAGGVLEAILKRFNI